MLKIFQQVVTIDLKWEYIIHILVHYLKKEEDKNEIWNFNLIFIRE